MRQLRRTSVNLLLLLFAALFMRAAMPAGYMPEKSADGTIAIALCNSDGVLRIPLKDAGDTDTEHRSAPPCAFAGLAGAATPPPDAPQIVHSPASQRVYATLPEPAVPVAAPRPLPPARGPPVPA